MDNWVRNHGNVLIQFYAEGDMGVKSQALPTIQTAGVLDRVRLLALDHSPLIGPPAGSFQKQLIWLS